MADRVGLQRKGPLLREYLDMLDKHGLVIDAEQLDISPDDVLLVIDMQNDFLPVDSVNMRGGRFGVAEGDMAVPLIVQLIDKFLARGARVVATRDYHPIDHVSFTTQGGHFPPHCVQGAIGSHFYSPIAEALQKGIARYGEEKVSIVFKGFHEDVDSFGSFKYSQEHLKVRLMHRNVKRPCGGCIVDWTGARLLKRSAANFDDNIDVNSPPDVLAAYSSETLASHLHGSRHAYVCGLALDFCVLDTAVTGAQAGIFKSVNIVLDASRAAYVPAIGSFGSGFLSNPKELLQKAASRGVHFVPTYALTHVTAPELPDTGASVSFPQSLGPLWLRKITNLAVSAIPQDGTYTIKGFDKFQDYVGRCSSEQPVFLYPLCDTSQLSEQERVQYICGSHDPSWELVVNGGFLEADGTCYAVSNFKSSRALSFGNPQHFKPTFAKVLLQKGAFNEISLPVLQAKGYHLFSWIGPGETVVGEQGEQLSDWPRGAFVYLDSKDELDTCIYFSVLP